MIGRFKALSDQVMGLGWHQLLCCVGYTDKKERSGLAIKSDAIVELSLHPPYIRRGVLSLELHPMMAAFLLALCRLPAGEKLTLTQATQTLENAGWEYPGDVLMKHKIRQLRQVMRKLEIDNPVLFVDGGWMLNSHLRWEAADEDDEQDLLDVIYTELQPASRS